MPLISDIAYRIANVTGYSCDIEVHAFEARSLKPVPLFGDAALTKPVANPYLVSAGHPIPTLCHGHNGPVRIRVVNVNSQSVFFDDDPYDIPVSANTLMGDRGGELVGNQRTAGSDLRIQSLSEFVEAGPLMPSQFAGTEEEQLARAIVEGRASRNGAQGQSVQLPRGELEVSSSIALANRVTLRGVNKRGSRLKATKTHRGPFMVIADNGTSSMFDNALEQLTLDCNDIAGLGGVVADSWQEGGGLRKVLIEKFRTIGVHIRNGFGGASTCLVEGAEIMGSGVAQATAGIKVSKVSETGNFMLHVTNSTITGDTGRPMARGIDIANDSLYCHVVHFEEVRTGIYLDGVGHHVLIGVTGAQTARGVATVESLVEIAPTFSGSLTMRGCFRGGATYLLNDNRRGGFGVIPYDTDITIRSEPEVAPGAIVASASINGIGTPVVTKGFGIASVVRNGKGDYSVALTRSARGPNDFTVFASTNMGVGNVRCDLTGVNSARLRCFDAAGNPADANEVKILMIRVG
ncbi:MAG: hypothetical protein KKA44_03245 [Alphaproteobacteria bacterium]|nr:hypothetical protein [Alphaproteobacteria bacterium]MBU0864441.1 hypothetical protein [Alphaproteobacteria bacterium]MBU1823978.1 hypothetical protein [Alphaproteobacteria bacterium]